MYLITSVGLVYLINYFNKFGVLLLSIPITIGFLWGVVHFEQLEATEINMLAPYSFKRKLNRNI